MDAGLAVLLLEQRDDGWARVVCSNGWSAWVDGRLLVARWRPDTSTHGEAVYATVGPRVWASTHVVPAGGMWAWRDPDPASAPTATMDPGLEVRLLEQRDDGWAQVACSNGWLAWVDGRRLLAEGTATSTSASRGRVLATVLFTDIVDSTGQASKVGDGGWRAVLDRHDGIVDQQIERWRGHKIKTTGDGVLATFDGPARAMHCALGIRAGVADLGLQTRAGLHSGEVELRDGDIAGIAVHVAQRVQSHAGPDEVLVSRTVADLVAGSGIAFADRGEHELKGVPGLWRLFAVET
jgi:class 3 adenylate cyclase